MMRRGAFPTCRRPLRRLLRTLSSGPFPSIRPVRPSRARRVRRISVVYAALSGYVWRRAKKRVHT